MKLLLAVGLLASFNCAGQSTSSIKHKADNSKYHTKADSVVVSTEMGYPITFSKKEFNKAVDEHPEFFNSIPANPDFTYCACRHWEEFSSEAGQDSYYALYAYFLKQRNGVAKYANQRKKLIDIYSGINALFSEFQYGGTYFGHQGLRILGYAEYSIHLLPKSKDHVEKNYDISKQKKLYIKSLRQLIEDENSIDFETVGNKKLERVKKLNKIVDRIEANITDNFYLRRAQEFHYSHYEYY